MTLLQTAFELQAAGRIEEAIDAYGEVARLDPSEPETGRDIVRALQQQGHLLHEQGREDEARAALARAAEPGGEFASPSLEQLHSGVQEAHALVEAEQYEGALVLLADLIRSWGREPPADAALQTCDEVVARFGESDDGVLEVVAWARSMREWIEAS